MDGTALRHRIHGIEEQVGESLTERAGIHGHISIGAVARSDGDSVGLKPRPVEREDRGKQFGHVGCADFRSITEFAQSGMRDLGEAIGFVSNKPKVAFRFGCQFDFPLHKENEIEEGLGRATYLMGKRDTTLVPVSGR